MNLSAIHESAVEAARAVEAQAKGLKHRRHQKHVAPARARIEDVLRHYWTRQEAALLDEIRPRLEHLLAAYPAPLREAKTPAAKNFASSLLPTSLSPLRFAVTKAESDEYYAAITDAIKGAAAVLADDMGGEASGVDFAARYLRDNSLTKLTGGINETSTQRLRDAVADAWQQGGSFDQITSAIKDTFSDFSDRRAEMIAQNEVGNAYAASRRDTAESLNYDEKSSEVESGNPCQDCLDNEAAGWIDIDDEYPSGDDAPLFHVNCECIENFRRSPGSGEE